MTSVALSTSCDPLPIPVGGSRRLVYVADDEPILLELASALLESQGCVVQTFRSGEELVSAIKQASQKPALLVTDYAMGGMTGLEAIEICKQISPGLKTFLVSGTVDESVFQGAVHEPDRFLRKPYAPGAFTRCAADLLNLTPSSVSDQCPPQLD